MLHTHVVYFVATPDSKTASASVPPPRRPDLLPVLSPASVAADASLAWVTGEDWTARGAPSERNAAAPLWSTLENVDQYEEVVQV